jgi:hypothetical protein
MITGETDDIWINAKPNKATEIQAEINSKKKDLPLEEQIPKEFHEYLDVFSEEKQHDSLNQRNGTTRLN